MQARRTVFLLGLLCVASGPAWAADDDVVATDTGAPLKVVVRKNSAVYEKPDKAGRNRPVQMFEFFYVLKPEEKSTEKTKDGFYCIASGPRRAQELGWIPADDVVEWPHRQALGLRPLAGRSRALFFKTRDDLTAADSSGTPPTPLSREPEGGADFNLVPILERFTMKHAGEDVDGYRVAYLHALTARRGGSGGAAPEGPGIDFSKATLDVVFVIDTTLSMQPHIDATKRAVAAIADKLAQETKDTQVRFGLVAYRDVIESPGPEWYVTQLLSDLAQGANHDAFQRILAEVRQSPQGSEDFAEDVFAGLKVAIQQTKWNPNAFKHIILMGDAGAQTAMTGYKNSERLTIEGVRAMAQPRGRENVREKITVHAIVCYEKAPDEEARKHFKELAEGGEYTGWYGEFKTTESPAFIEELVLKCQAGLEAGRDAVRSGGSGVTAIPKDTPGLGLLLEMVEASVEMKGDIPSFASGYCCELDADGNAVFEPYLLVQHGRLSMFSSFLDVSVKALRTAGAPGSRDVKQVVQSVQMLATLMNLGEPVRADMPLSELAKLILGFPVRNDIFDMTFAKLAAMAQADFDSWVANVDASRTVIQSHLDNTRIWRSLGPDVPLDQRHCFLKVSDLP